MSEEIEEYKYDSDFSQRCVKATLVSKNVLFASEKNRSYRLGLIPLFLGWLLYLFPLSFAILVKPERLIIVAAGMAPISFPFILFGLYLIYHPIIQILLWEDGVETRRVGRKTFLLYNKVAALFPGYVMYIDYPPYREIPALQFTIDHKRYYNIPMPYEKAKKAYSLFLEKKKVQENEERDNITKFSKDFIRFTKKHVFLRNIFSVSVGCVVGLSLFLSFLTLGLRGVAASVLGGVFVGFFIFILYTWGLGTALNARILSIETWTDLFNAYYKRLPSLYPRTEYKKIIHNIFRTAGWGLITMGALLSVSITVSFFRGVPPNVIILLMVSFAFLIWGVNLLRKSDI